MSKSVRNIFGRSLLLPVVIFTSRAVAAGDRIVVLNDCARDHETQSVNWYLRVFERNGTEDILWIFYYFWWGFGLFFLLTSYKT